ncbi:MAG: hypothetical protein FJX77_08885 [Armatimonadetes bacterium]|nr:hypothetical protein [Armatimonadota bacterium]
MFRACLQEVERLQQRGPELEPWLEPVRGYKGPRLSPGCETRRVGRGGGCTRVVLPSGWTLPGGVAGPSHVGREPCILCLPQPVWEIVRDSCAPESLRFRPIRISSHHRMPVQKDLCAHAGIVVGNECHWVSLGWGLALLSSTGWGRYLRGW